MIMEIALLQIPPEAWIGIIPGFIFLLWCLYYVAFLPLGKLVQGDYRIVERKQLKGKPEYIVQRKCFGIWKDETYFTDGDEYCGMGDFKTLKEAQDYISHETGGRDTVVISLGKSRDIKINKILK